MRVYAMPDFEDLLSLKRRVRKKYSLEGREYSNRRCPAVLISVRLTPEPEYGKKSENSSPSPLASSGPGGHKASFRSTKLARRARSFKDDFLGKISQMRGPVGGGGGCAGQGVRSNSPKGRSSKMEHIYPENKGPIDELDALWKQIELALKHFRDVFKKQIFLMLPGNGTLILDSVWHINLAIKSSVAADSSSSVTSATQGMYQSVARLIKLCDDVLINCDSAALDQQNVEEVVSQVEHAVRDLIELAKEKIKQQQSNYKTVPRLSSYGTSNLEMNSQRNSLPDIPLTPRERDILEKTSNHSVRGSHSTESILQDSGPPPKPPLPDGILRSDITRCITPPPLPPKKKNNRLNQVMDDSFTPDGSPSILERLSLRSKSPDDSISLLSGSGSLDSMLNMSREEEEIKALMDPIYDYDNTFENHCSDIFATNGSYNSWEESSLSSSISNHANLNQAQYDYHRLSNTDSGIVSSESYRSSYYSKRSSQQSTISTQQVTKHSVNSSSEMVKSESFAQSLAESATYQLSVKCQNQQKTSSSSSIVSTNTQTSSGKEEADFASLGTVSPPPLPQKTKKKQERQPSPYDNVPEGNMEGEVLVTCRMHQSHQSLSSVASNAEDDSSKPPPLPVKKRHIMAYMEMFGNCQSNDNDQDFMRHSVHMTHAQHWVQQSTSPGLPTTQSCSFSQISNCSSLSQSHTLSIPSTDSQSRTPSPISASGPAANCLPPALPPKQRPRIRSEGRSPPQSPCSTETAKQVDATPAKVLPDLLEHTGDADKDASAKEDEDVKICDVDLMEKLTVDEYLVFKKPEEEGPDIRGGTIDALIIQATKATKNGVFTYQEAFLTTYRTFITPFDLISKLIRRYNFFYYKTEKRPRSREAFALMVRVVSDLTSVDLDEELQQKLMNFVQQLISCGELTLAKALRVKHLERHEAKQRNAQGASNVLTSISLTPRTLTLLDFKSEQIAEQMTLLDAELFMKIEIPEVLIWAQEQNEERSPNLTLFTEHFNKMSYWARTKILQMNNKETREKYFLKFIKIMKHLRKINNFNSYLALLSALDSAPIRRLEWQKHVQEGLKEYCALIDSSSSFRAYRQALAETQPPCIPYIGLVLQDLTFVHIGNTNLLPDGMINFSKRWQQFNIVENMKKFKKCTYSFKKNERIIQFFENFDDIIPEDAMWQLSESIKPRGGKKTT
ncbi:guanine nucleotide-releasing factor 2 isoform X2 [Coccinella septempunctata]|uniref:guanine nucleotide-releasing factor 2 isoform X2 n=1 Tax=Coccinella septempunctata TaxID=41139 RepID=UPI001D0823BA|nr:guanine nucleotide-releasing factor 2 isoform X2 [Coccinella septempunctata]